MNQHMLILQQQGEMLDYFPHSVQVQCIYMERRDLATVSPPPVTDLREASVNTEMLDPALPRGPPADGK